LSPGQKGNFVALNCSSISETLAESELFGHVKGAFTGAHQDKVGVFEYAEGGVVLLDEIGEMPLPLQAKLLRVLQNQEVQRVGSPAVRKVSARVVAATNRDLPEMVSQGKFREDLYFRLCMIELKVPSLAERREDLPILQRHFLKSFAAQYKKPLAGLTRRAQTLLSKYSWPGNVRELENVIGHACMMTESDVIDVRDLPPRIQNLRADENPESEAELSLDQVARMHAQRVLAHVGGNKVRAAEILGISRTYLYELLKKSAPEQNQEDADTDQEESKLVTPKTPKG
jgi:DNA-binding NtrC family response regulator